MMSDLELFEIHEGRRKKVAIVSEEIISRMGPEAFFPIQKALGRMWDPTPDSSGNPFSARSPQQGWGWDRKRDGDR